MYKKLWMVTVSLIILLTVQVASAAEKDTKEVVIKAGIAASRQDTYGILFEKFAKVVGEKTNNKVKVTIYSDGQLGGDLELIEQVATNSIQLAAVGVTGNKSFDLLFAPYIFRDGNHMFRALRGELGQMLGKILLEKSGVKIIGYAERNPRELTAKIPIKKPSDVQGLKIRVPEVEVMIASWKAVGAQPTPMAFPEVFTSLQTGVIDAQENPIETIYRNKFYEVQSHLILTDHNLSVFYAGINNKFLNSLDPKTQKAVLDSMKIAEDHVRGELSRQRGELMAMLKKAGMTVITPDVKAFKSIMVEKVTKPYADKIWGPGVYESIQKN